MEGFVGEEFSQTQHLPIRDYISLHWLVFTAGSPGRGTQQGERKLTDSWTPRWRRGEAARVSSGNCDKSESIKVEYNVNKEVTIVLSKLINERRFTPGLI